MSKIDTKNSADKTGPKMSSVIGKKIKKYFYYSIALFILITGMYV
jgi:hypothetical protein